MSGSRPTAPASQPSGRVDFIDLLRGLAVLVMIETHVFNATLTNEVTAGTLFQYLKFANGLVAPSFLFASGLAYAITIRRKIGQYLSVGPVLFRQLGRLALIGLIGYMMHIPVFSAGRLLTETSPEEWQSFFQVDILQCIAINLLFLQICLFLFRNERRLFLFASFVAGAIVFFTPMVWRVDFWNILPWPVAGYMNGLRFSLFPVFPWSAFLFAGAITGYYYKNTEERALSQRNIAVVPTFVGSLCWAGGSSILLSIAIAPLADKLYPSHDYWRVGPSFFLLRLGLVILLAGILYFGSRARETWAGSVILLFGRESLLVYVLHLLLIYGDFGSFNLSREVSGSFGYAQASLLTAGLVVSMYFTANVWSYIKRTSPRMKVAVNIVTLAAIVGMFFLG